MPGSVTVAGCHGPASHQPLPSTRAATFSRLFFGHVTVGVRVWRVESAGIALRTPFAANLSGAKDPLERLWVSGCNNEGLALRAPVRPLPLVGAAASAHAPQASNSLA